MILGFGNNVVSALASDITASQTTIPILPGGGAMFAALLTSDYSNKSTTLKNYAKITLTDAGETAFEICHLISVSNDTLTVIRGQEGTAAKGWSLKDVVANFATRGSENQFVQADHVQSGFYIAGTAGGTANALTLELPSTFFLNGSTDWDLKTPIVVYPTQNNTGASTLQLTMGGRVLGTFKLYKGNKAELVASDILKDTGLVCLLDNTKTFFNVMNPGAIYAGLGTAAFHDVQTSQDDVTPGRVLVNGGALALRTVVASSTAGAFTDDCNNLPANSVSFAYASAKNSPGFEASILDYAGLHGDYNVQLAANYAQPGLFKFRTKNGDYKTWSDWSSFITSVGGKITGGLTVDGALASGTSIDAPVFNMSGVYLPGTIQKRLPGCLDCNYAPFGWSMVGGTVPNAPFSYGTLLTLVSGGTGGNATTTDPTMQVWYQQTMWSTDGQIAIRTQTNTAPWTEWSLVYSTRNPPPSEAPTGIPMPWPSPTPPNGWAACVGQQFNISLYPQLAAAYPAGYIPDMRGVFIRGWDNSRGIDPGRGINSLQYGQAPASGLQRGPWGNYAQIDRGISVMIGTDNDGYPNVTQESESQRETRPINVAFNYIVRLA